MSDCKLEITIQTAHVKKARQFLDDLEIQLESSYENDGTTTLYTDYCESKYSYEVADELANASIEGIVNVTDLNMEEEEATITLKQVDGKMQKVEITKSTQELINELQTVLDHANQATDLESVKAWLQQRIQNTLEDCVIS